MVHGEGGKFGILGNVGSTSYGSHWAGQGPNPTSLRQHIENKQVNVIYEIHHAPLAALV
jgi:hypothetical protein